MVIHNLDDNWGYPGDKTETSSRTLWVVMGMIILGFDERNTQVIINIEVNNIDV
jgi:hypothetical protein